MTARDDLTVAELDALKDVAQRVLARRARGVRTGAAVKHNDWTDHERDLNGAKNDLRTAQFVYEKAKERLLNAEAEFRRAEMGVQRRTERLEELQARVD